MQEPIASAIPASSLARRPSIGPRPLSVKKKLLFAALTMAAFFLLPVAAIEIGGRVYIHYRYGVPGRSYGLYMGDDELGATHRPNAYNTNDVVLNNWGFRNTNDVVETKSPGSMRVYCSGGSTTFCYNLGNDESWPSLLQGKLRELPGHENDEVLNAGQICFSVAHEFTLAKRQIPRLRPDVVLIYTGINEGLTAGIMVNQDQQNLDALLAGKNWGVCAKGLDQARFLKRHSILVRMWDYQIKKYFEQPATAAFYRTSEVPADALTNPGFHPYVKANFEHTLRAYLAYLRGQGCQPVVVRFGDSGADNWYFEHGPRVWREQAVAIARAESVPVCDIAAVVDRHPRRAELFIDSGVHVTREGAELVADELHRTLQSLTTRPAPGP